MAVPDKQPMNDASETDQEEESNPNEAASENQSVVNEEASNTGGAEVENRSDTDEVASENPSTTDVIPTSSRQGLLSLPSELRVDIFRHLLLRNRAISTYRLGATHQHFPPILNTCALIRREAFQVLFGENTFYLGFMHPTFSILSSQHISDTIQNVRFDVRLNDTSPNRCRRRFIDLIQVFGSPAIVRGTLDIIFRVAPYHNDLLAWFYTGLPRFTNFRTLRFEFVASCAHRLAERWCFLYCTIHRIHFTPAFGPGVFFADGRGVQFRPQQYLNSIPPAVDIDWMDYLDGIRLSWNQDPPANANESEASAQNSNSET